MNNIYSHQWEILRDEEEDHTSRQRVNRSIFILFLILIGMTPLLISSHISSFVSPVISDLDFFTSGQKGDLFSFYKFSFLILITIAVTGLFFYKLFFLNGSITMKPIVWFIFLFLFAVLLSACFAPYKTIALYGTVDRRDGSITYLCYLVLLFVSLHIKYPKKTVIYILYSLVPFLLINFTLCLMNFTGHDALQHKSIVKALTLFTQDGSGFKGDSQLLGTLDQWNYMSGMFGILTTMYLAASIIDTSRIRRSFYLLFALLSLAIVFMAVSTSGFLTILALLPFVFYLSFKNDNKKAAIIYFIIFLVGSLPILHTLSIKSPAVWTESVGFIIKKNPYIPHEESSSSTISTDQSFSMTKRAYAAENKALTLPELPEPGLTAGTGRLYIWKKTLQLMPDRLFVGYGLDSLAYHFPQYDVEKRSGLYYSDLIVDKPHNSYLGILFGTGIFGMIGLIGIAAITLWKIGTLFFRNRPPHLAVVLGVAWMAYLIQGLFNDSIIGISAPLWVMAGIMVSLTCKEEKGQEQKI